MSVAREIIERKIADLSRVIRADKWKLKEPDLTEGEIQFYKYRLDRNEDREWILRDVLSDMEEADE